MRAGGEGVDGLQVGLRGAEGQLLEGERAKGAPVLLGEAVPSEEERLDSGGGEGGELIRLDASAAQLETAEGREPRVVAEGEEGGAGANSDLTNGQLVPSARERAEVVADLDRFDEPTAERAARLRPAGGTKSQAGVFQPVPFVLFQQGALAPLELGSLRLAERRGAGERALDGDELAARISDVCQHVRDDQARRVVVGGVEHGSQQFVGDALHPSLPER